MCIREATLQDTQAIKALHLAVFPQEENELVAQLAVDLLNTATTPSSLCLVAEVQDEVAGFVGYSPISLERDKGSIGYILTPLAVATDHQGKGIGSQLVSEGIKRLTDLNCQLLMVYGDPNYYCRFGFAADLGERFLAPYPLEYPFGWLAMSLNGYQPDSSAQAIKCLGPLANPQLW